MWGVSLILMMMITIIVPLHIEWPLAAVSLHNNALPFFGIPQLMSAVCILSANIFLYYHVTVSNRKAKENERLGNEDEVNDFKS